MKKSKKNQSKTSTKKVIKYVVKFFAVATTTITAIIPLLDYFT